MSARLVYTVSGALIYVGYAHVEVCAHFGAPKSKRGDFVVLATESEIVCILGYKGHPCSTYGIRVSSDEGLVKQLLQDCR